MKPADDDGGEEAEANCGSGLQEQAEEDARGVGLKIGDDDVCGLPGAGPDREVHPPW